MVVSGSRANTTTGINESTENNLVRLDFPTLRDKHEFSVLNYVNIRQCFVYTND